jgi:hypothetical protein
LIKKVEVFHGFTNHTKVANMALEHISSCGILRGVVKIFFPQCFLGKHGETIDFSDVFFRIFPEGKTMEIISKPKGKS